jgi:hypothetical protein
MAFVFRGKKPGRKPRAFESRAEWRGECFVWTGPVSDKSEYPRVKFNGKTRKAHHVAYEMAYGPLPKLGNGSDDLVVMHSCDNQLCINPKHLSLGTKAQNTKDAITRSGGKQWADKRAPRPHLRKFDRNEARELRQSGMTYQAIADRLKVNRASVQEALLETSHA